MKYIVVWLSNYPLNNIVDFDNFDDAMKYARVKGGKVYELKELVSFE